MKPRQQRVLRVLENVLTLVILLGSGWYLVKRRAELAASADFSLGIAVLIGLAVLVAWFASYAQSYLMYRAEDLEVTFRENCFLGAATAFGNYLPMRAGAIVRARYMKAVHGFGYTRSGSIFGIRVVLMTTASGLLGLVGCVGVWLDGGRLSIELLLVFSGLLAICSVAFFRRPVGVQSDKTLLARTYTEFVSGFAALRNHPRNSLLELGLMLVQYGMLAVRFWLSMGALNAGASLWLLLVMAALAGLSSFIALTPGNLGVREALMGYVTVATGHDFDTGVFAGALDRLVVLTMVLVLGGVSFAVVSHRLRKANLTSARAAEL